MNKKELSFLLSEERRTYNDLIRSLEGYPFKDSDRSVEAFADTIIIKYHAAIVAGIYCEVKTYIDSKALEYAKAINKTARYMRKINKDKTIWEKDMMTGIYSSIKKEIFSN